MRAQLRIDTTGGHTVTSEMELEAAQAASDHFARESAKDKLRGTLTLEGQPHITVAMRHIAVLTVTELK